MKMNKDKLENFIVDHRDDFNDRVPNPELWNKIDAHLGPALASSKKTIQLDFRIIGIAATLLILLGVGVLIGLSLNNNPEHMLYDNQHIVEYQEAEQFFVAQVDNKWNKIKKLKGEDEELKSDLEQLDDVFDELKAELLTTRNGNTEQVVSAMIMNYGAKIELLERVLERIESQEVDSLVNIKKLRNENIKI